MTNDIVDIRFLFGYLEQDDPGLPDLMDLNKYLSQIPYKHQDDLLEFLQLLAAWQMPSRSVLAALAYCLNEYAGVSFEQIEEAFGNEVYELAQSFRAFELSLIRSGHGDLDAEEMRIYRVGRLRQLLITAYSRLELALLCLAAHVIRMRSLDSLSGEDARYLAEDSQTIFMPLIQMLGIWQLRDKLGDVCLRALRPADWEETRRQQELIVDEQMGHYERIKAVFTGEITSAGIKAHTELNINSVSSLHRRKLLGEVRGKILRPIRINIFAEKEGECYLVSKLIEKLMDRQLFSKIKWKPKCDDFKDLIHSPKFNGYRTIIRRVDYRRSDDPHVKLPVEFRICSKEMEEVNVQGVIATGFYSKNRSKIKNAWWENEETLKFVRSHPVDTYTDELYVFSPTGEVYSKLPKGSTPIDYAYRIHPGIGQRCKSIWVNGRIATYDTELSNGDFVEIKTDPQFQGPREEWLSVVKTSAARNSIALALAQSEQNKSQATSQRGRKIIQGVFARELKAYGLRDIPPEDLDRFLENLAHYDYRYPSVEDMYVAIANRSRLSGARVPTPDKIVYKLISSQLAGHIVKANNEAIGIPEERIQFRQCVHNKQLCRVVPGKQIIGRVKHAGSPFETLIVYRKDCQAFQEISQRLPGGDQILELDWRGARRPEQAVEVIIDAVDKSGLVYALINPVYELYPKGLYLLELHAKVAQDSSARIQMKITSRTENASLALKKGEDALHLLREKLQQLRQNCLISDFTIKPLSDVDKILLARRDNLPNPYTRQPVHDVRLFKGREAEQEKIASSLHENRNLLIVYGAPRIGKTSLLKHTYAHGLHRREFVPVIVDYFSRFNEYEFWHTLACRVYESIPRHDGGRLAKRHFQSAFKEMPDRPFGAFKEGLSFAEKQLGDKKLVIMIDEFTALEDENLWPKAEARLVVLQLKSLIENQRQVAFILCVHENVFRKAYSKEVLTWPLLAEGTHISLGHLDARAARRLIQEPLEEKVKYDDSSVEEILKLTSGHPYYLHLMLYEIISRIGRAEQSLVTLQDLEFAIDRMFEEDAIFYYFEQQASDLRRVVAAAVAYVSGSDNRKVTIKEIRNCLEKSGYAADDLSQHLMHLCDAGILEHHDGHYCMRLPLFGRWLLRTIPLGSLILRAKERNQ